MTTLKHRDLEILNFIARFGYCQEQHLAILCNLGIAQTKRIIARLEELGYITCNKVLAKNGSYVFLTSASGKLLDVKIPLKPNLNTLLHDTLLVDLYFFLINNDKIAPELIKTDKQIRKEFGIFSINSQQRVSDLLIDNKIAIELELSEKPKARLQEIINTYIIDNSITSVCYFLKSASLLNKIYTLTLCNQKFKFFLFETDENTQFIKLQQHTSGGLVTIDKLNLMEVSIVAPKRFGNYQF